MQPQIIHIHATVLRRPTGIHVTTVQRLCENLAWFSVICGSYML